MIHLNRVLFATDGSACAERARAHAFAFADRFEAALHVIHVEEREVELSDVVDLCEEDVLADLHPLEPSTTPVAEPRIQECRVVHPSAAGGILSYAAEHDTDLIVLGTHGRRGVQRLVLGSVAEEVVRRAPRPVLTVGRGASTPASLEGQPLLVPIDFSEHQGPLLAHARELARAYDMTLILFHAVEMEGLPDVYGLSTSPPESDALTDRTRATIEEQAESLRDQGVTVQVEVRNGHPAEEILEAADEFDVHLLAIATHGRSGVERMLMGSVAEKVIRQAPCPVFTVKSFGTPLVPDESETTSEEHDTHNS